MIGRHFMCVLKGGMREELCYVEWQLILDTCSGQRDVSLWILFYL